MISKRKTVGQLKKLRGEQKMTKKEIQKNRMIRSRLRKTDPRLLIISDYIKKLAQEHNVPVSEIHLNINEPDQEHLTIWRYKHKPSSEFINILELDWKNLETKKI